MTKTSSDGFRRAHSWIAAAIATVAVASAACSSQLDADPSPPAQGASPERYEPASARLQGMGIQSYRLTQDASATGPYNVTFRNGDVVVGELDQDAAGTIRFSLHQTRFVVSRQEAAVTFHLGENAGTLTASVDGEPVGDAASLALWERAKPHLDAISAIATELGIGGRPLGETNVTVASASCRANPMYVNGVYLNVFCPFNRVASCQSWLQNNCPFGRVCSNDSRPGDCFRGLEACGGYCNCSTFGTLCSQNSDCCSNNCRPPGGKFHIRTCG